MSIMRLLYKEFITPATPGVNTVPLFFNTDTGQGAGENFDAFSSYRRGARRRRTL